LNPKISVVIISYNQAEFLEETIVSVINQDYENKEIIVIDGGSTDRSPEIIKKYSDRFAFWASEPDRGQSDAIMKGFGRSNGDLIGWINSDDLLIQGALAAVANKVNQVKSCSGVFYGGCFIIDSKGKPVDCSVHEKFNYFVAKHIGPNISQPGTFCNRDDYNAIGGLKKELQYGMDLELFFNFLFSGYPFYYTGKYHAKFRKHASQKGHSKQYLEKCIQETRLIHEKYGLSNFTPTSKKAARSIQVFLRIVRGYYVKTLLFRYRHRRSFREYNAEYSA
jgi:glycosyltransferase involved in cell wall biosynthesis